MCTVPLMIYISALLPLPILVYEDISISVQRFKQISDRDQVCTKRIEYILEWSLDNPSVWILSVPFSLKGSSKCKNHLNVHKLYAVEYINTVCSLD